LLVFLDRDLVETSKARRPGVVDPDVQMVELSDGLICEILYVLVVAYVCLNDNGADPTVFTFVSYIFQQTLTSGRQDETRSLIGELEGGTTAKAAGRACDDDGFVAKSSHVSLQNWALNSPFAMTTFRRVFAIGPPAASQ
jgi:hypothetical protein